MNPAKKLIMVLLALMLPGTAAAEDVFDFEVDGIYYKIVENEACVTYKTYTYNNHNAFYESDYTGDVTIPATVTYQGKTYSVTKIDDYAFFLCGSLTSVTIPSSVITIGHNAFSCCDSLSSIEIPSSVTLIGYEAFSGCTELTRVIITDIAAWCNINFENYYANPLRVANHLYMNGAEVTDLRIPETVTAIGQYAFHYCKGLASVEVPNSVTAIGVEAFNGCTGLQRVRLGNALTSIDYAVFGGCIALKDIVIPNSVTSIDIDAFYGCTALTDMTIPNSVTTVGNSAFRGCSRLTRVSIGNSVTEIGASAFHDCTSLSSVDIGNSVRAIGKNAFQNAPAIETITCRSTYPAWWNDMSMFTTDVYNLAQLHVPVGCEGAYKADHYWGQFLTIIGDFIEVNPDGDVNGDGEVTIADANSVIDVVVMGGNSGHTRVPAADVNGDGEINIADINAIIDLILSRNSTRE